MAQEKTVVRSGGVGFGSLLAIVFIVLKLCGVIAWSWWWVLAPIWIPFAIAALFLLVVGSIALVAKFS
jgi:hypothetical protein